MSSKALLLGTDWTAVRTLGTAGVAVAAASFLVVLPWEPIRTAWRYHVWAGLVAVGLGLAARAGRRRGGLLAGCGAAFLATCWIFVVPPLAALVRGDAFGDGGYAVPRPSAVGLSPRAELLTGLRVGPVVALAVALTAGSAAYALGAALRRRSERSRDA
ncbi:MULTISPECIES: hypothetical protein [Halorubrum]|uniref:Uncharacterized protein n=1 Tax=Halorubrum hochstenium ATCC 700873 TaxID=1227481 RepID=M0FSE9_9EURY|nr:MULTISPECIES: hypothetical protein [Halorubrum]ELZ61474.1 hypothetical protein C467_01611 [Halorubrum hochstenium ATCC 700873]